MSEMLEKYPFAMHFGLYPEPGRPYVAYRHHDDTESEATLTGILLPPFEACPLFVSGSWKCWGPDDQGTEGDHSLHVVLYLATMDANILDLARAAVLDHVSAGRMIDWGTVTTSADWSLTLAHWIWDQGMGRFQMVHGTVEYSSMDVPSIAVTPGPGDIVRRAAMCFLHSEDPEDLNLRELAIALGEDPESVEALGGEQIEDAFPGDLPRDDDGEIVTSAEFGESYMVEIEYGTDADGRVIDPGKEAHPRTFHGPFGTSEEAVEWMNAYPDSTDVHDMRAVVINNVRPKGD